MLGVDYAWQHPDPQAIKAAGYDFVCRYYSHDPTKNLTRQEADALAAAGLWIVGNWEHTAQDALGGYPAGVANAKLARQLADACGQPAARPIYESDDWDVTPEQEPIVTDYLRGWDSVLGVAQVGEYGGFYPLRAQLDAGVTSWAWQTRAWSGGQWEPRVNIRQTGTAVIGGVQVDVNEALTADFGQWQPGRLPEGAEMDATQANQLAQVYNALFPGGPSMGTGAPGEPNNGIASTLDYLVKQAEAQAPLPARVDALAAKVDALAVPSVTLDATAAAAALAAVPGFTDGLAAAMVRQLLLAAGNAASAAKTG